MLVVFSRFNSERIFEKKSDTLIEFTSYDTLYFTQTGNNKDDPDSIDPDGGPYLYKGYIIRFKDEHFKIVRFGKGDFNIDTGIFVLLLEVEKIVK